MKRARLPWLALLLGLGAAVLGAQPAWLHAKAALAQLLLQRAWQQRDGGRAPAPWPWADTHPVARLEVPNHGVDQIVLAGDSGRTLAFGPGWAQASAVPGQFGTVVVSAHRDTHFAFLRNVSVGETVKVHADDGSKRHYRVTAVDIVDSSRARIATGAVDQLLLVTCWPFDAASAGGTMRYVVTAEPEAT